MAQMCVDPPAFLKCLDLIGKRFIPTVIEVKMALCAMQILIQFKGKLNDLPHAIHLLSSALSNIEFSIGSLWSLELCIENEDLIDKLKLEWSNFCAEFVHYLCFAKTVAFATPVAIQVISRAILLMSSNNSASIAILWSRIPGTRRTLESVSDTSRVTNLVNLRKACIASFLPIPLVKAYVMLTGLPSEK
jgi:hypothetical protein